MSETLESPEGKWSVHRKRCEPIPLRCVDVGTGNEAEIQHGLPPRNAAQFNWAYVAARIMLRSVGIAVPDMRIRQVSAT